MDNDGPEHVMVFLGDLGRDLPRSERDYGVPFCMAVDASPSETAIRRAYIGEFANPTSGDLVFRMTYEQFCQKWREKFGWDLFRPPNAGDEHILQGIRLPLTDNEVSSKLSSSTWPSF